MGMILRIASSRIVGQGDIVGRSGYFSLNLSANSVMRGRLDARRTLKSLVADLRHITSLCFLNFNFKNCPLFTLQMQAHPAQLPSYRRKPAWKGITDWLPHPVALVRPADRY